MCYTCQILSGRISVYTRTGNEPARVIAQDELDQHLLSYHNAAVQWQNGSTWTVQENNGLQRIPPIQNHRR